MAGRNRATFAEIFEKDTHEFRPVPFWAWDAGCREDEIKWQLKEFRNKGIYEVIIFPVYGLELVCFSDRWWQKMAFVASECSKLGMKVWLYDELNWPSGNAAGFVLKKYPWAMCQKLYFKVENVKKGQLIKIGISGKTLIARVVNGDKVFELTDYKIISKGEKSCFIWPADRNGKLFLLTKDVGRAKIYSGFGTLWTWNQAGALDVLSPEAVKKFIEISYAGGEKYLKKYFGNVIRGFFTDEPSFLYGGTAPNLPFTEGLFEKFEKRYGYRLPDKVHHLVFDTAGCCRTRYDYWSLITELFSESYNRQIADWCKERGLLFTGHYLEEEGLAETVLDSGDIYQAAKHLHVPGIDILETTTSFEKQGSRSIYPKFYKNAGFNITAKLLTSTARHIGAQRVLCEAFGTSNWALTLEEMKKMTDWLVAMGVNLINDNLIPYSIKGFRRIMGGKNYTSGWWKDYKLFADYCGRICRMTTVAPEKTEIGILYPTTANRCLVNGQNIISNRGRTPLGKTQNTFYGLCDFLLRSHLQFDFLFDDLLKNGLIKDGVLELGKNSYKIIILPDLPFITEEVGKKLKIFAEQGGTLVLLESCPSTISQTGFINNAELKKSFRLTNKEIPAKLVNIIRHKTAAPFSIKGISANQIISSYREKSEEKLLFLSNIWNKPNRVQISFKKGERVEIWDPSTGARHYFGARATSYRFEPYESKYFYAGRKTAEKSIKEEYQYRKKEKVISLGKDWDFSTQQPNLCLLDSRIRYDEKSEGIDRGWYQDKDWYKWEKVVKCSCLRGLDPDYLKYYWLAGEFELTCRPVDLGKVYLVVDGEQKKDVFVNGNPVTTSKSDIVWDRENRSFDITVDLKQGQNVVMFRSPTSPYLSGRVRSEFYQLNPRDVEPVVIRGRFSVSKTQGRSRIIPLQPKIKTGSWTIQGYPNFSGTGIYRREFFIVPVNGKRYWLDLGEVRDTVEVSLNRRKVSVLAWHPFRTEVTGFLKAGKNQLELKVSNNLGNLLKRYYSGVMAESVPAGLLAVPAIRVTG